MSHQSGLSSRATLRAVALKQRHKDALKHVERLGRTEPLVTPPSPTQAYLEGIIFHHLLWFQQEGFAHSSPGMMIREIHAEENSLTLRMKAYELVPQLEGHVLAAARTPEGSLAGLRAQIDPAAGSITMSFAGLDGRVELQLGVEDRIHTQLAYLQLRLPSGMGPPGDRPLAFVDDDWDREAARVRSAMVRRLGVLDILRATYIDGWMMYKDKYCIEVGAPDDISLAEIEKAVAGLCSPQLRPRMRLLPSEYPSDYQPESTVRMITVEGTSMELMLRIIRWSE